MLRMTLFFSSLKKRKNGFSFSSFLKRFSTSSFLLSFLIVQNILFLSSSLFFSRSISPFVCLLSLLSFPASLCLYCLVVCFFLFFLGFFFLSVQFLYFGSFRTIRTHKYPHTYIFIHTYTYSHTHTHTHTHIHTHTHTNLPHYLWGDQKTSFKVGV